MSRKKLPKGITWFVNHESDENYFNPQDRLGHSFKYFENYFDGVKGDDFTKEALYNGDPTKRIKNCRGDLFEERTCAWHNMDDKFINIGETYSDGAFIVGTQFRYHISCDPKYYNKI